MTPHKQSSLTEPLTSPSLPNEDAQVDIYRGLGEHYFTMRIEKRNSVFFIISALCLPVNKCRFNGENKVGAANKRRVSPTVQNCVTIN